MKKIITLIAVVSLTGCGVVSQKDLVGVPADQPPADTRIPGGWLLYGADATGNCMSPTGGDEGAFEIPCRDVLNVCVQLEDGSYSAKWNNHIFRCTDESPTWHDVCLTVPVDQLRFYGYAQEDCANA